MTQFTDRKPLSFTIYKIINENKIIFGISNIHFRLAIFQYFNI